MTRSTALPTRQNMLDIFHGEWVSAVPGFDTGAMPLFNDDRIKWAGEQLGGFQHKRILELGPLEGGHTYMMDRAGADEIIAIEANSQAFLKCLLVQDALTIPARFLYGDFMQYLPTVKKPFDMVIACGVLYHMTDPVELIRLISLVTDRLFLWTHYTMSPDGYLPKGPVMFAGRTHEYTTDQHLGGVAHTSFWLTRTSIIEALKLCGFGKLSFNFDQPNHPHGPAIAICAQKE